MNKRRVIRTKSAGYYKRERWNIVKIVAVLAMTAAIGYYGFLGIKCYKHCQGLLNNRISTISFALND
jgi:hypothetical protein